MEYLKIAQDLEMYGISYFFIRVRIAVSLSHNVAMDFLTITLLHSLLFNSRTSDSYSLLTWSHPHPRVALIFFLSFFYFEE